MEKMKGHWKQIKPHSKSFLCLRVFSLSSSMQLFTILINCRGGGNAVQIVQRHHFASHLKRMAVIVRIQEEFLVFVKVSWLLVVFVWVDVLERIWLAMCRFRFIDLFVCANESANIYFVLIYFNHSVGLLSFLIFFLNGAKLNYIWS